MTEYSDQMNKKESTWIKRGYQTFALEGPKGLKIERLAHQVQKNKSSFYHHYSDLEIFTEHLLAQHLNQAYIIAEKESRCSSLEELIDILVSHKYDLLFNRQLRIHRENPEFRECFEKTNEITTEAIREVWAKTLGLAEHAYLADLILKLGIENFYLQITLDTLNHGWLHNYFAEFKKLVKEFRNAGIER